MQRLGEKGLIWLKRDLRVRDHAALAAGRQLGATSALFLFLNLLGYKALNALRILQLGIHLIVREGEATEVLAQLQQEQNWT